MVKMQNKRNNEDNAQIILDLITDMNKTHQQNFSHKKDLWTLCQNKMQYADFEEAIRALIEDGVIYSSLDEDTYGLTE